MQTKNPFLDDVAKLMTGAAGALAGARDEAQTLFRQQIERFVADQGLATRDEVDAALEVARKARAENEALTTRIAALEALVMELAKPKRPRKISE